MDWKVVKARRYLEADGVRYDLSHLEDVKYQYHIEASGKHQAVTFSTLIQFSSHCVSWGAKRDQVIDFSEHGQQRRILDHHGHERCFCPRRHQLSLQLPQIFETLLERKCIFTGRENWLTVEIVLEDGEKAEYEIYFNVTRQSSQMLRIYVESGYVADPEYGNQPKPKGRRDVIKAKTLLTKKLRNEPVRRPNENRSRKRRR